MYWGLINSWFSTHWGPGGKLTTRRIKGLLPSPPPAFFIWCSRAVVWTNWHSNRAPLRKHFHLREGRQERLAAKWETALHFHTDLTSWAALIFSPLILKPSEKKNNNNFPILYPIHEHLCYGYVGSMFYGQRGARVFRLNSSLLLEIHFDQCMSLCWDEEFRLTAQTEVNTGDVLTWVWHKRPSSQTAKVLNRADYTFNNTHIIHTVNEMGI